MDYELSQQENMDYLVRQLDKVHPPKSAVKVIRQYTRELKRSSKREHEKAQLETVRELISALGKMGQGLLSNQIAGTAFFVVTATALYPAWFPIFRFAIAAIAKDLGDAWKLGNLPTPPTFDLPTTGMGQFCFTVTLSPQLRFLVGLGIPVPIPVAPICALTAADRDALLSAFKNAAGPLASLYEIRLVNP